MAEKEYIEREAAIAVIEEKQKELCPVGMYSRHAVYGSDREKFDAWEEIIEAIEAIPAADVRPVKWIPVTERLPEDDTGVLAHVYWPKYGDTMVCYGHWHKGWCHLYHHVEGELISGYVVTHWMPLPSPPAEE